MGFMKYQVFGLIVFYLDVMVITSIPWALCEMDIWSRPRRQWRRERIAFFFYSFLGEACPKPLADTRFINFDCFQHVSPRLVRRWHHAALRWQAHVVWICFLEFRGSWNSGIELFNTPKTVRLVRNRWRSKVITSIAGRFPEGELFFWVLPLFLPLRPFWRRKLQIGHCSSWKNSWWIFRRKRLLLSPAGSSTFRWPLLWRSVSSENPFLQVPVAFA